MKKVVTLGTLREDIYIKYDFSEPLKDNEINVGVLEKNIGGSVNNTCQYIALKDSEIQVIMCTQNFADLIINIQKRLRNSNYIIVSTEKDLNEHPISIVGIKDNGDKQMISYDPKPDNNCLIDVFKKEIKDSDLIYTSFYEINEENYTELANIFNESLKEKKYVMMDLCPLLDRISCDAIESILKFSSVLSGNENEFELLMKKEGIADIYNIFSRFSKIEKIYVKRGERGASLYIKDNGGIKEINVDSIEKVNSKNTTGCGDVFNASVIVGLLSELDDLKTINCAVKDSSEIAKGGFPWIKE